MKTIKSPREISEIFSRGRHLKGFCVTVLAYKNESLHDPGGRVAFIAGKKLGGAVWRNKAKRRLRAVAKEIGAPWSGYDIVFIAKQNTTSAHYNNVVKDAERLVQRIIGP